MGRKLQSYNYECVLKTWTSGLEQDQGFTVLSNAREVEGRKREKCPAENRDDGVKCSTVVF